MLMSQALTEYLRVFEKGAIARRLDSTVEQSVVAALFHCLIQTLTSQTLSGTWGTKGPREETAYAVLTLARLLVLPHAQFIRPQILSAIDRGRTFLLNSKASTPEHLWIEKVTYGSANLAEAYIVAALYIPIDGPSLGKPVVEICPLNNEDLAKFGMLICQGPLSKSPRWIVLASWIESRLYVLSQQWSPEEKSHFETIAFWWFFANNKRESACSWNFVYDMISLSTRIHKVAILTQESIARQNESKIQGLVEQINKTVLQFDVLDSPFDTGNNIEKPALNGVDKILKKHPTTNGHTTSGNLANGIDNKASKTLSSFFDYFRDRVHLSSASESDINPLNSEAKKFLDSQITHLETQKRYPNSILNNGRSDSLFVFPDSSALLAVPAGFTGIPLLFSLALSLQNKKHSKNPSRFKDIVLKDIRERAETCFLLKQRYIGSARGKDVDLFLSYQKSLLLEALQQINRFEEGDDIVKNVMVILDYTEIGLVESAIPQVGDGQQNV